MDEDADAPPERGEPGRNAPHPTASRGPLTIRDLETREREHLQRMARAERRERTVRALLLLVALALAGVLGLGWQGLTSKMSAASGELQQIQVQVESQVTEVVRYAPLPRGTSRGTLDKALAEMASQDLRTRVAGIHRARAIMKRQLPPAEARFRREFLDLYPDFRNGHEDAEVIIRNSTSRYRKAAAAYSAQAAGFPGNLLVQLLGMPNKLPEIKP